jgi:hypothetical protein
MSRTGFATLFAAAAALMLITAAPVRADDTTNGIRLNGEATNGIKLNGEATNGIRLNGEATNGVKLNGIRLNGRELNGQSDNGAAQSGNTADTPPSPLDAVTVHSISTPSAPH